MGLFYKKSGCGGFYFLFFFSKKKSGCGCGGFYSQKKVGVVVFF